MCAHCFSNHSAHSRHAQDLARRRGAKSRPVRAPPGRPAEAAELRLEIRPLAQRDGSTPGVAHCNPNPRLVAAERRASSQSPTPDHHPPQHLRTLRRPAIDDLGFRAALASKLNPTLSPAPLRVPHTDPRAALHFRHLPITQPSDSSASDIAHSKLTPAHQPLTNPIYSSFPHTESVQQLAT